MITNEEPENYLSQGEGLRIEFKEASSNFPHSSYETLVSFSNKEGGIIVLGINDDRDVIGINETYCQKIKDDISSTCKNTNIIFPSIYPSVSEVRYKTKLIIIIKVSVSSQVSFQ